MRACGLFLLGLLAGCSGMTAAPGAPVATGTGGAAVVAEAPQALLERHLAEEVPYWLDEPRLHDWLRERNGETAVLDDQSIADMAVRWGGELDAGSGPLTDRIASRFASKYLAEVVLRADGAYREAIVLDLRNLVAAAGELPEQVSHVGDSLVEKLAADPDAPWVQDVPATASGTLRVALPLDDPDNGQRSGTLLLVIDMARLARLPGFRQP